MGVILAAAEAGSIDMTLLLMGLFGGLAVFLLGMDHLTESLKAVAGDKMRLILGKLTTNRFMGIVTGAGITAVIQSSSVTTVLVVGFISSGLMSLSQAIGVIMGANIGTTITAQIIAFKVTKYALALVAVGFGVWFFSRKEPRRHWGGLLMGLGLVFFGMALMGDAMSPLRSSEAFVDWMASMTNPLIAIGAAALFTALVQSSSATTGIVIVLAGQGLISLELGIALIFGSNIGTSVTAILASIGKPREAARASVVHVLFNVLGVAVFVAFIDQLADVVRSISPSFPGLAGAERLAAETPRQIANSHTIFNVINTLLFVGFASQLARFAERLVPDRPLEEEERVRARYLDDALLSTPVLALDRATMEMADLAKRVRDMLVAVLPAVVEGTEAELASVEKMDDGIDALHAEILTYLGKVSQTRLSASETDELMRLMEATNNLEAIGDILETNLVALGRSRLASKVVVSEMTKGVIGEFHAATVRALDLALDAVQNGNVESAVMANSMKDEINALAEAAAAHQARRLVAEEPNRVTTYKLETDVAEHLKRVYYFTKRTARAVLPILERSST